MRLSKIMFIGFPLILAGCNEFFGDDTDTFHAPQPATVQAPELPSGSDVPPASPAPSAVSRGRFAPKKHVRHTKPLPSDQGKPARHVGTPPAIPSSALPLPPAAPPAVAPVPDWHPSEGHLVRAGDLVMEQQRNNGGVNPSHAAKSTYIQSHMGLTAHQAELVLEELGL